MAATTLRLPDALKAEAEEYAARLGISLNALLAVTLREYLDGRLGTLKSGVPSQAPSPLPESPKAPLLELAGFKAPASRSDPCPCGGLDARGYPIKWKHCHGKAARVR